VSVQKLGAMLVRIRVAIQ